jgi:BirA family biotin operon repressor/biotin-[acetyl-CoA-carboxylase] ligase
MTGPALPGHFTLIALDEAGSTNAEAQRLAAEGAPDGTIVWARRQTAGRGRRGRGWTSEEGNLYLSLLLRPDVPAPRCLQLGFVTANVVADTVASVLPRHAYVHCKWPNDVLVEGRKVAGILLEAGPMRHGTPEWLVIGVGVNVRHHPDDAQFPATDLDREGGGDTVENLLVAFCRRFLSAMVAWRNIGFADARRAWLARAWRLGKAITVRLEDETLEGTFTGLDEDGTLLLDTADGPRRITAGDVFGVET